VNQAEKYENEINTNSQQARSARTARRNKTKLHSENSVKCKKPEQCKKAARSTRQLKTSKKGSETQWQSGKSTKKKSGFVFNQIEDPGTSLCCSAPPVFLPRFCSSRFRRRVDADGGVGVAVGVELGESKTHCQDGLPGRRT